jgi:interleukin-1 receptor-associated kinase 1
MCLRPGDFGLAREGTESLVNLLQVSRVYGTRPYLPLDFISNRQLSPKVDTYSFGIVLFELATGLPAYLKDRIRDAIVTGEYKTMVDKSPPADDSDIFEDFIQIGALCTANSSDKRPEMLEVFNRLDAKFKSLTNNDTSEL